MNQTKQWLLPIGERLGSFFDRYLTHISVAVLGIGLFMVFFGPVRSRLLDKPTFTGNDGAITAMQIQEGVVAPGENLIERFRLNREIEAYTTIPERPRDRVVTYTIQRGDTLFGIAGMFNLDPNTIFWANSDKLGDSVHTLLPGVELFILPVNGVYHLSDGNTSLQTIARLYEADVDTVLHSPYNSEFAFDEPTDVPDWGIRVVVPGGQREIVDYKVPVVETDSGGRVTSFMAGMDGSCGSFAGRGGTGAWIPPVASGAYSFTQSFYPGHSGVDLAGVEGTPVYAADSGVVAFAGWVLPSWGYGKLVVLDHGNGWTSYYAHLSSVTVGCGSFIQRGGTIGAIGNTGNSTGPHVHFEMRWNHTPDNPAYYVGF